MAAPTNLSALTAIDLGTLPASVSQTVDDAGTTYTVWYSYTATSDENVINVFAFGDLTVYKPILRVYLGPAAAPISYLGGVGAQNRPIQIPVTPGTTYYFEVVKNSGNPSPAVLTLTSVTGPMESVPVGSIVVNDDTDGFPAALVDSTTGDVLRFVSPFPAGEKGDTSADGHILVNDDFAGNLVWFDAQFNRLTDIAFDADAMVRTNIATDTIYVANRGGGLTAATVTTVDNTGALGGTVWTLASAGFAAGCVSPADTILYYAAGANSTVKRWDLVNDVALSDLVAIVSGYVISDFLGLADGSILALYYKSTVTRDAYVKQYSAAGTTVRTFNLGSDQSSTPPRLAYALNHPTSFWVMSHTAAHFSVFTNLLVSDGSTVTTFQVPEYEGGAYQPAATATPSADFGVSFSCPFFLSRVLYPAAGTGTIRVVKVVIPETETGLFTFSAGGGLSPTTFTIEGSDEQVFNSVAPGDGYSIVETDSPGFQQMSVTVSNDSLPTNISVDADEVVIVTVTNAQTIEPPAPGAGVHDPIRWVRRPPTVFSDGKRVRHTRLQLDMQVGVGLSVAADEHDHDPIILVRSSDDNGQTWSSFREMTMGAQGNYLKIARLFQLGAAYNRVYELSGDSPVKFCLVQAFLDIEGWDH